MQIKVCSREMLIWYAEKPWPAGTTLVSIYDSDDVAPVLRYKPDHVLQLAFDDIVPEMAYELCGLAETKTKTVDEMVALLENMGFVAFSDEMAKRLASFIAMHLAETKLLVCQCQHGQSRSAAVAAAVCEVLQAGGSLTYFGDDRYSPNRRVYDKLLEQLLSQCK